VVSKPHLIFWHASIRKPGVTDHPQRGWLGFYRHGLENTKARTALIGENNAVEPWILAQRPALAGFENTQ
jgi:hypothetical protein